MKVSILIPLYNSEKYVAQTIKCALNQTWSDKEIIVVDDGSSDNSYEIAKSYESAILKVYQQENKGSSAARNAAFELSNGDYIQYLDSDDILPPNKISAQMSLLEKDGFKSVIISSCHFKTFTNSLEKVWTNQFPINKTYANPIDLLSDSWLKTSYIASHAWLCPRSMIDKAGPWNTDITLNDDGEFFSRVIIQAKKVIFCEETEVYYRNAPNSVSKQKSRNAMVSWLNSIDLVGALILKTKHEKAIEACSKEYSRFIYNWYPNNRFLVKEAKMQMAEKGLSFEIPENKASSFTGGLSYFFGWKGAKRIIDISKKIVPGTIKNALNKFR